MKNILLKIFEKFDNNIFFLSCVLSLFGVSTIF